MKQTCAKHHTTCVIITEFGTEYHGTNLCLTPQEVCPREDGEGYEKCRTICNQVGHAEEIALLHALHDGANLEDSRAEISHDHACEKCTNILHSNKVFNIVCTGSDYNKKRN